MKDVLIKFKSNGGYDFDIDLVGKVVAATTDSMYGLYYVTPQELVRVGANPQLAYEDTDWAFEDDDIDVVAKWDSREDLLDYLNRTAPRSKRIRRAIKWAKKGGGNGKI